METVDNIKQNIDKLLDKYYEVEKELKKLNNYTIGDGSEEDVKSSSLVLLWINIRSEIFYNRVKLVKAYEDIL